MTNRASVVPQLLGAAVGIVLGTALLFAVIGMLRDDGPTPEVVADGASEPADETVAEATPEPTVEPSPDEESSPEASPEPEPEAEPTEDSEPATAVDPATVSIQVLNAVGADGAAASRAVADELREAGYNVVVINRASREYAVTTVFWSPGQEAAGRQVAAFLSAGQAEETPEEVSLSDSVEVHVVVGVDRT